MRTPGTASLRRLVPAVALLCVAVPAAGAPGAATAAATVPRPAAHGDGALPLLHAVPAPGGGRIVDADGREVVLRGVAVNALGRYGRANAIPPTYPFRRHDVAVLRRIGWNVVRLVLNWSAVEPKPGRYDARYLRHAQRIVRWLGRAGIYSIVDMHQDAWSDTLGTRKGETCPAPLARTLGFDGAPGWATLGRDLPHCQIAQQEGSLAVYDSWQSFLGNAAGPGGVGVQTRFLRMWRHVAETFARSSDVAGFDVLNEPLLVGPLDDARAATLNQRTVAAIRSGERAGHGVRHIVMVEPSILFSETGADVVLPFRHDSDVAFAPHIYTGTFPTTGPPDNRWFTSAGQLARTLGGVPVVDGEWGGRPRSRDPIDTGFYRSYQALLDRHRFGGVFWVYRSTCGDPFEITQHASQTGGLYAVDCRTNRVVGLRRDLVRLLARPYPRAVAGRLGSFVFQPATKRFRLAYQPRGGVTAIAVPRLQYPTGYRVRVEDGHVISSRNARVLRVQTSRKSKSTTTTVIVKRR